MVKQRTTVLVMALAVALLVTGWPQPGQAGPAPIPYYFTRAIKPADLKGKTLRELTLMRNTIYARAGNTFRKKWLRAHFEGQPWYKPTGLDPDKLTDRDRANADAIARHEMGLARADLEQQLLALRTKYAGKEPDRTAADLGGWSEVDAVEFTLLHRALGLPISAKVDPDRNPLDDPSMLDGLVTVEMMADMSPRDLKILRNMVFARRGRAFKTAMVRDYFARMAWYKADKAYSDERLTENDWRNIKMVESVEKEVGLQQRQMELREREEFVMGA